MGTVTGIMVTGMVGMVIMMGMVGTTITVMATTGMIGLMVGAMGIATWDDDRGPRFAYGRGYGSGGYPGYGAYAAQDTTIRPTNVSTPGTAGIHAPTITMAIRARR